MNEANNCRSVIACRGTQPQASRNQLQQTVKVESRTRGRSDSSGGTIPPSNPPPASVPFDVVDTLRELMAAYREETTAMLRVQLEASCELAEKRDRILRDELTLIKNEMELDQE